METTNRNFLRRQLSAFAGFALAALMSSAAFATPVTVNGDLSNAGTSFSIADLQGLPSTTETLTINGETHSYTGVQLWTVLGGNTAGASNIVTQGGGNNPILRNFVVASGSGGERSIVSAGEINPLFGGTTDPTFGTPGKPALVVYQKDGVTLATPQLIVGQDGTGTRNITDLSALTVGGVDRVTGPGGVSHAFNITDDGHVLRTIDSVTSLSFLTEASENVTFQSGANIRNATFTGVSLWDLLTAVDPHLDNLANSILTAVGSDGFQVVFSLAELNPALGGPDVLLAYGDSTGPNGTLGTAGDFRLVVPGDARGGRFVSNLISIDIHEVPEPATLALLLVGLMAIFALRRSRTGRRFAA